MGATTETTPRWKPRYRKMNAKMPSKVMVIPVVHHLAHAASAYYFSGFASCAAITVDGNGETDSTVVWKVVNGEFERVGSSKTLKANVRIISATNANPHEEVAQGRFRQDLLFRLNTIEIAIPPLRERREDIMPLANNFLRQHAKRYRKTLTGFEEKARDVLMQHHFPGNVRELDHVVERAVLMTQGQQVKANDLGLTSGISDTPRLEDMSLEDVEAFLIKKALSRFDGNARKAAEALGLSRSAFYRRLQQYGL